MLEVIDPSQTKSDLSPCHPEGQHHDCIYVSELNRLIPKAIKEANDGTDPNDTSEAGEARWASLYHAAMDRLATAAGLRKQTYQG